MSHSWSNPQEYPPSCPTSHLTGVLGPLAFGGTLGLRHGHQRLLDRATLLLLHLLQRLALLLILPGPLCESVWGDVEARRSVSTLESWYLAPPGSPTWPFLFFFSCFSLCSSSKMALMMVSELIPGCLLLLDQIMTMAVELARTASLLLNKRFESPIDASSSRWVQVVLEADGKPAGSAGYIRCAHIQFSVNHCNPSKICAIRKALRWSGS